MSVTTALQLFAAGYTDLVSVIPPDAKLSERSDIPLDQRGKAPGKYNGNQGVWAGYNWREFKPLKEHLELWEKAGANVGLHAHNYPAVDIDCMDADVTARVVAIAKATLGDAPMRHGRRPKVLLVYGTLTPFTRMRLHLKRGDEKHLIEVLGDGQQYLVAGVHPVTRQPYEWDRPLHEVDSDFGLALIDPDKVEAFFTAVTEELDLAGWTCEREGRARLADQETMVQEELRAPSFEACERAVAALPNRDRDFPSRDSMNEVGYAIKASVGEAGLPLFVDWACRWDGGTNDPEYVADQWARMVPPFRLGWEWLVGRARALGGYSDASDDFAPQMAPTPQADDFDVVAGPPAPSAPDPDTPPPAPRAKYGEQATAARFANRFGNTFKYVEAMDGWQAYRQGVWVRDDNHKAEAAMQLICREYAEEANIDATLNTTQRRAIVMTLNKAATMTSVLKVARSDRTLAASVDQFDSEPFELNTPAGIVDLRTGKLEPHTGINPRLVTRMTGASPSAGPASRWLAFLDEALAGDKELIDYLQRKCGYWLTGSTEEQELTFVWGPGGNGKGVFANTISRLMGSYAVQTQSSTFASTKNEQHPEALARLRGARLVIASEVQEGQYWDETKVKQATGGDVITARFMSQNSFDYRPQFKLLFLGNHKPRIRLVDNAMKRRFHLVPMTVQPRKVNKRLVEELLAHEGGQILHWMIEGAVRWLQEGLGMPRTVVDATNEYLSEEDTVGRFLADYGDTQATPEDFITSQELHQFFNRWCADQGEHPKELLWLSKRVNGRPGIRKARNKLGLQGFYGIRMLVSDGGFGRVGAQDEFKPAEKSPTGK